MFLLSSCTREEILELDYSRFEKKLVLFSVISPQTDSIFVALSETSRGLDSINFGSVSLPSGKVVLSDNDNEIILKQLSIKPALYGCAQSEFAIQKGKQYTLYAVVDGYPHVSACTTVPEELSYWNEPQEPIYGISIFYNWLPEYTFLFESEWIMQKQESGKNYFAYKHEGVKYYLEYAQDDSVGYRGLPYRVIDSSKYENKVFFAEGEKYSSDNNNFKFKIIVAEDVVYNKVIRYGYGYPLESGMTPSGVIIEYLTFYILTVDKHYAAYRELSTLYNESFSGDGVDDLFFSSYKGILPSFTNVEGGYGLFGSFGYDSVFFDVRHPYELLQPIKEPYDTHSN